MQEADILLSGGLVVADSSSPVVEDGAVAVRGDRIVEIGPRQAVEARTHARESIDCTGKVVMPGLIDCHVHACQHLARGIADDVPVAEWLGRVVSFESLMNEDEVVASVRLACIEMIKSGTTGFIEACANPLFIDSVAECFAASGLRAILTRSTMEHEDPTWAAPSQFMMDRQSNVEQTEAMIARWNGAANDRISAWSGWRHQQEASDELLREVVQLADAHGVGLHAHLGTRQHGEIERLHRLGLLRRGMVLAHAIHFTPEEVALIKQHDIKLDHNPGASMHGAYGSVHGQFPEFLQMGVCVCLGCDAGANNNTLDMFREMRLAATLHKEMRRDAAIIPAEAAFEMATANGARACMWEDVGTLKAGGKADLIVVDITQPHIAPVANVLRSLVYSVAGADVQLTMVDGQILMRDRILTRWDEKDAVATAEAAAARIRERWTSRTGFEI